MSSARKPRSAFAVILGATRRVLVVQKQGGNWGLPGGGIHKGESPRKAALRELAEETGLRARDPAALKPVPRPRSSAPVFVLRAKATKGDLCGPTAEIRRQRWVKTKEALRLLTPRNAQRLREALPHT